MIVQDTNLQSSGEQHMVLDTPLLKVSRPVAACSRCRAAKIKCDGKLPACTACEKNGKAAECASANDNFARGKERSFVSTLETRIEKLERRLREAQARKSSTFSMQEHDAEPTQSSSSFDNSTRVGGDDANLDKKARQRENLDIDAIVSDFGFLTVNATSRDYYGFTSFMSYARLVLSACAKEPLPTGLVSPLPPRHLATMTIQHYLDHIYTLLPFFDETSLYYSIDSVYKIAAEGNSVAYSFDHWCVRMILAVSNAWMSEKCGDECHLEAMGHVAAALKHAENVLRPGSITSVQALLFLSQYAMVDPHHFDSWSLIGAASRAMIDLGLHQDPHKGSTIPKAKLDLRRRIFWSVYTMDRTVSIVQTRSFSFSDDSAHVSMPYQAGGVQGPKTSSHASRWLKSFENARDLVNLRKLQSKWYQDLFQSGREAWAQPFPYLWQTCHNLANCFNDQAKRSKSHVDWFQLELLYSYIYVLSPSPRVPTTHPYVQNLIFEYCISYSSLMSKAINITTDLVPVSFYDAMRVYMTGRQFLDLLNHNMNHVLSGAHAEPPTISASGAPPPPAIPNPPMDAYTNTGRAMNCIRQFSDSLGYLGKRWGYSSWQENFDKVAEPMNVTLRTRLWECQQDMTRPHLMRQSSSNNSVPTMYDYSQRPSSVVRNSSNDSGSLPLMESMEHPTPPYSMYTTSSTVTGAQLRAARQSFAVAPMQQHSSSVDGYGSMMVRSDGVPPMPVGYQQGLDDPGLQFSAWGGLEQNPGHGHRG